MNDRRRAGMSTGCTVGVVGLGLVGAALSERLHECGFVPIGFDIEPARMDMYRGRGWETAASVCDLGSRCKVAVLAVYDATQVEDVLSELASGLNSQLTSVVCVTTFAPKEAERLATLSEQVGLPFIEMPISGTSEEIAKGSGLGIVAGDSFSPAGVCTVLEVLCPSRISAGVVGNAGRTKLAINLVLQLNRAALAEGIVFAEAIGLDPSTFLKAAQRSAAASAVMATKGRKMIERDFKPQSRVEQTLKDATLILTEAEKVGLSLPLFSAGAELLRRTIALCGGGVDSAAIIQAIRPENAGI